MHAQLEKAGASKNCKYSSLLLYALTPPPQKKKELDNTNH